LLQRIRKFAHSITCHDVWLATTFPLKTPGQHIVGPPTRGVGIEFEEVPLPPGHAFFHGEKEPPPLRANVVIAVGNCGLYLGRFWVRVEDTMLATADGNNVLTTFPRRLA
jgi:Xaa-Pro aminopeptidase